MCGNLKEVRYDMLKNGHTKSCNCLYKKSNSIHGMYDTRLYTTWQNMKSRCYYNKNINYNWATSNGYADNLEIDRIDINGNYEPDNCRWITHKEQQQNIL